VRLIIDTNIFIAALLKDSMTRKVLLNPKFDFYIPEFFLQELLNHFPELESKSGLSSAELRQLINLFLEHVHLVPLTEYKKFIVKAIPIMSEIDENDIPFIALSLAIKNDGIWSNDVHFKKQEVTTVYTTQELMELL